jgi:Tol biopolymer transport system component
MWWKKIEIRRGGEVVRTLPIAGDYTWLEVADWSPDGKRLLLITRHEGRHTIRTMSAAGGVVNDLIAEERELSHASFVAGGDAVLYLRARSGGERDLVVLRLAGGAVPTGEPRTVIEGLHAADFSLSRDGNRFAYTKERGPSEIWIGDLEGAGAEPRRVVLKRLLADSAPKDSLRFSPDGSHVSYSAPEGPGTRIFVLATSGGQPRRIGSPETDSSGTAWSPDGREVAFTTSQGRMRSLWIHTLATGSTRQIAATQMGDDTEVHWAPSPFIAFHGRGNSNYWLVDPATGEERPLLADDTHGWPFFPTWSPDRRQIAYFWNRRLDGPEPGPGVWVVGEDGRAPRRVLEGNYAPKAWSADGRSLYLSEWTSDPWGDSQPILEVSVAGGAPRPFATLSLDRRLGDCVLSVNARRAACTANPEADVWLVDDFDRLLRAE